jgi:hypothetical protein
MTPLKLLLASLPCTEIVFAGTSETVSAGTSEKVSAGSLTLPKIFMTWQRFQTIVPDRYKFLEEKI